MPRKKGRTIYFDTNAVLDFILKRSNNATLLVESIKSRRWSMITSTLTIVEMSDWKKRDLFIRNKLELNWGMDSIFNQKNKTDLGKYEFEKVEKWLLEQAPSLNLSFVDLSGAAWEKVREISTSTNLLAKDALHFGTALAAAVNDQCDTLITSDGDFKKEADEYLKIKRLKQKLKVMTPKEFVKEFPPSY